MSTLSAILALGASGSAWAATPKKIPLVLSPQIYSNVSYLSARELPKNETLSDQVFLDAGQACVTKDEAERRFDAYEKRMQAGLVEHGEEIRYSDEVKGFAKGVFNDVGKQHAKSSFRRFKDFAEESLDGIREPIAAAVFAASFYTGKVMKFRLAGAKFESRTALKDKDASLSMLLPGLRSTVAYTDENKVSASLTKDLDDNISAVLDTADKGTVQLRYGVSF